MIPFNLEKALAGEKVVTRDGSEVTQMHKFNIDLNKTIFGVVKGAVRFWHDGGRYMNPIDCNLDLYMAPPEPKQLSGFVNVYTDRDISSHGTAKRANAYARKINSIRTACIDLSQHNEGEGI